MTEDKKGMPVRDALVQAIADRTRDWDGLGLPPPKGTYERLVTLAAQARFLQEYCVECGNPGRETHVYQTDRFSLMRFAELVAAAERERCADLCDAQHDRSRTQAGASRADACAAEIRRIPQGETK